MTNLDSILKSRDKKILESYYPSIKKLKQNKKKKRRDITLPAKVHLVKSMVFPVVMYGYKSCTIKKAEH